MSEQDYEVAVDRIMEDKNLLYSTIKKDIHRLGIDLSRRYSRIRMSYDVFLIGLVISLIMFAGCHIFFG